MGDALHITSGDIVGDMLRECGIPGDVCVWHDVLYDGPRRAGWPDEPTCMARARFLVAGTAGALDGKRVLETVHKQYHRLAAAGAFAEIVLWFDACLFDQAMLAHILTCLRHQGLRNVKLLCVAAFPGIVPYHGLGQLTPAQLAGCYGDRRPVTDTQFQFAGRVDEAFATQELGLLSALGEATDAPLPWVPAAVRRWLEEWPDAATGLGRLERLALQAIRGGCATPRDILAAVAAAETPPQFWGDTTLWAKINGLADRNPPLVCIEGPAERLPQWNATDSLNAFRITRAG